MKNVRVEGHTEAQVSVLHPMRSDRTAFEHVETPLNPWTLKSWMGYAALTPRLTVRVCSYCPDARTADAYAAAHELAVTHSICPQGSQKRMREILGEVA